LKTYHGIEEFQPVPRPVVTIGTFDGVHLGHQKIFNIMAGEAARIGGETIVITFDPHPRLVIHPDSKGLKFINTQSKKYDLISKANIDHLIILPFTKEFSNLPSGEFVRRYLVEKINTSKLIVGYDHHFGKDRQGGYGELRGLATIYGFEVIEVQAQLVDGIPVSSTKIRKALLDGDLRFANKLLGYEYSITGKVIPGNHIGKKLGFPTANIELNDKYKLVSAIGVYACRVEWNGRFYKGMGNIGYRPTVEISKLTIEVNIFDFDETLYGDTITIYFVDRIRDEVKFKNLAKLREQLINDRARVMDILK
jgi:riboflavin kinase/FMN adenylyltransferase